MDFTQPDWAPAGFRLTGRSRRSSGLGGFRPNRLVEGGGRMKTWGAESSSPNNSRLRFARTRGYATGRRHQQDKPDSLTTVISDSRAQQEKRTSILVFIMKIEKESVFVNTVANRRFVLSSQNPAKERHSGSNCQTFGPD
jgi:hypothetical protein